MAWLKWRGTPAKGKYYALWKENDGVRPRTRWKALSRNKREAEALKVELERNLLRQGVGLGAIVKVTALREKYVELLKSKNCAKSYIGRVRVVLGHVERIFPGLKLPALTSEKTDAYKTKRLEEGAAATTVRREVGVIKSAVRKGVRWNFQIPDLSQVEKVQGAAAPKKGYTPEEVAAILRAAAEPGEELNEIIAYEGLFAGMRRGEMLQHRKQDLDWAEKAIMIGIGWATKTRDERAVPMNPLLEAKLRAWLARPEAGAGERVIPWDRTPQAFTGRFIYFLRRRCGIPHGGIHWLRHTFITELKREDVETGKIMKAAGQKTEKVTQGYIKLQVRDLREPVGRLNYGLPQTNIGGNSGTADGVAR